MSDFVDVDFTTDAAALVDNAIDYLAAAFADAGIDNWTPNEGDLEIILLAVIATMAADAAETASQVPAAIFRKFGTGLMGIPYLAGASAIVDSTWTATDTVGYTIPANTYVTISSLGFFVSDDAIIAPGDSSVTDVRLVAVEPGTLYNGSAGPIELVAALDFIQSVDIIGVTSGGQDPETDDDYQNRLAALLRLQAPRPITATDYQTFVLSFQPATGTDQQEVGRAVAIDGYQPDGTTTFTATTTNSSATLTAVSGAGAANVGPGTVVAGAGITVGTKVLTNNGSTIVMTAAATANHTAETITATGIYNQARCVTDFIAAADGTALNSDTLIAAQAWLLTYSPMNFLVYVLSPAYTTVYVTFAIKCYPSADPDATVAAAQAALMSYLNPAGFGQLGTTLPQSGWINDTVVRYNKLIGICESVAGVDYVSSLTVGLTASPVGTVDVAVGGPVPLVQSTTSTILGSAV